MACRISKIWQAFWDWSWDELVSFDLPALFDFVYGQTGQKIDYVGHSLVRNLAYFHEKITGNPAKINFTLYIWEIRDARFFQNPWNLNMGNTFWQGTLIALASFSEGKLRNQLKSAALLTPIAYLSHMKTALGVVAAKSFVGEVRSSTVL